MNLFPTFCLAVRAWGSTLSLCVAVAVGCGVCIQPAAAQAPTNYDTARLTKADAELLLAVESHHLQPGLDKMRSKLYAPAWGDFDFILRYFPNHPRALVAMADLCQAWKSPKCRAEEYFEKALVMSPKSPSVHLAKGIYLQKNNHLSEAIDSYKNALAVDPNSFNANYNLGLAYAAQKQYAVANEYAQRAYALGPALPGLRDKLIAAGAWKPVDPPPSTEAK